ncbi:hypothetical protein L596_027425 [Steinernema carpocapsae]|nr:hypothetical protein L596_027425 [Steinernema carpocapsae]
MPTPYPFARKPLTDKDVNCAIIFSVLVLMGYLAYLFCKKFQNRRVSAKDDSLVEVATPDLVKSKGRTADA